MHEPAHATQAGKFGEETELHVVVFCSGMNLPVPEADDLTSNKQAYPRKPRERCNVQVEVELSHGDFKASRAERTGCESCVVCRNGERIN